MQDKGVVVRADYVEHLPPDVSAAQYWLNNRKGYDWKSKVEHEHSGKIGLEQLVAGQGQEHDPETPSATCSARTSGFASGVPTRSPSWSTTSGPRPTSGRSTRFCSWR